MAKLTIVEDGTQSVYELFEDQHEVSLGRGAANAVQIHDNHASKHHASIRRIGDRWKLVDLESKNGTRVNGAFKNQHWLANGDAVSVGDATIAYGDDSVAAGAPIPAVAAPSAAPAPAASAAAPVSTAVASPPPPAPAAAAPSRAAPSRSTTPSRGASRRRERDDYDYDDDHEEERPRRRGGDDKGPLIVLLGIVGILVFVFLMIKALEPTEYQNQKVRVTASDMANRGDPEGAIVYAEKHGRPDELHWIELKEEIDNWKEQVEMRPMMARNAEARTWFEKNIFLRTRTSMFRAKDAMNEEEAAAVLREFLVLYAGTGRAKEVLYSKAPPYPEYREMMRANASDEGDPGRIVGSVRNEVESLAKRRRFGEAVTRLEDLRATQQVLLSRDRAEEVRRLVDQQITQLKSQARRAFERDMEKVQSYLRDDKTASARHHLQDMIDTYGLPNLVSEAKLKLDDI